MEPIRESITSLTVGEKKQEIDDWNCIFYILFCTDIFYDIMWYQMISYACSLYKSMANF